MNSLKAVLMVIETNMKLVSAAACKISVGATAGELALMFAQNRIGVAQVFALAGKDIVMPFDN